MKGFRKIKVGGKVYNYKICHSYATFNYIDDTTNKKKGFKGTYLEISNWDSWDKIERGCWKNYFSITPKMIADFIKKTVS